MESNFKTKQINPFNSSIHAISRAYRWCKDATLSSIWTAIAFRIRLDYIWCVLCIESVFGGRLPGSTPSNFQRKGSQCARYPWSWHRMCVCVHFTQQMNAYRDAAMRITIIVTAAKYLPSIGCEPRTQRPQPSAHTKQPAAIHRRIYIYIYICI